MPRRRKATRPCLFCGSTASVSREHVIPRWVNKELGIRGVVEERSGTARRLDALSVVLPQVCIECNTGWMHKLERRTEVPHRSRTGDPIGFSWKGTGTSEGKREAIHS
jgi:hypothetical protein